MIDAQTYDWSRFEIVEYYDAPIEAVFGAWATAAGLESFFIQSAHIETPDGRVRASREVAQSGDRYRWEWRHPASLEGEITSVVENEAVSFTFGNMKVAIRFASVGDRTEVHLVQTGIADTPEGRVMGHLNCRSCWVFFLVNLKSVLGAKLDLRDVNPDRASAIEVGFVPLSQGRSWSA